MNKKIPTFISSIFIFLLFIFAASFFPQSVHANSSPLSGWAWSSNIGWISFNSGNPGAGGGSYSVNLDTVTNVLSGYAWSSNIGWISFNANDVASCNPGPCTPTVNLTTGKVSGWARAVSGIGRTDGWNGWIQLSGTNNESPVTDGTGGVTFIPSTGAFKGYAWGGNVVGWVQFNPSITNNVITYPISTLAVSCSLTSMFDLGSSKTYTWTANPSNGSGPYSYAWNVSPTTASTYTTTLTKGQSASPVVSVTSGGSVVSANCPQVTNASTPIVGQGDPDIIIQANDQNGNVIYQAAKDQVITSSQSQILRVKKGKTFSLTSKVGSAVGYDTCTLSNKDTLNRSNVSTWNSTRNSVPPGTTLSSIDLVAGIDQTSQTVTYGTNCFKDGVSDIVSVKVQIIDSNISEQ